MKPTMKTLAAVGLTLAAGVTIPACGGITSDFCNERCSCEDCSDIGRDECVIDTDRDLEIASVYGCDDAYEARKQCEIKSYTCVDGRFLVTINDVDPCAVEAGDLNRCLDDGSGIR
jgi:hypothetical protein